MKITARAVTLNFKFKEWELNTSSRTPDDRRHLQRGPRDRMINLRPELPGVKHYVIIGERKVDGMLTTPTSSPAGHPPSRTAWDPSQGRYRGTHVHGGRQAIQGGHLHPRPGPECSAGAMIRTLPAGSRYGAGAAIRLRGIQKAVKIPGTARFLPWLLSRDATRRVCRLWERTPAIHPEVALYRDPRVLGLQARLSGGKVRMVLASPMMHAWAYNHASSA